MNNKRLETHPAVNVAERRVPPARVLHYSAGRQKYTKIKMLLGSENYLFFILEILND